MTNEATIDLKPFCGENGRYMLGQPWTKDGKRYATDGSVAVRLDVPGAPDRLPDGRVPNINELVQSDDGDWLPWPAVAACKACRGRGVGICTNCCGDGQCDACSCCMEHRCGYCDGSGQGKCYECREPGSLHDIRFGAVELSLYYAWLVSTLPNVVYLPADKGTSPVRFRFDGGEGAVMGVLRD